MDKKISRNDPCFCGSGKKYKKCHSDLHPDSRAAHLIEMHRNIEEKVTSYQKKTGIIPPCHKGCYSCCFDDFSISEVEFEYMMREMKTWDSKKVEEVYNIALEQCEQIKDERPETWEALEKMVDAQDVEAFRKQLIDHQKVSKNKFPCPMLDQETKSCTVYDSRPLVCRTYGTTHVESNALKSVELCENISDSVKHANETPSADLEQYEASFYLNLTTPDGQRILQRTYPIYYWFKIFYKRTGKKIAQYNHYDNPLNFNQSIEQADLTTLRGFNLI